MSLQVCCVVASLLSVCTTPHAHLLAKQDLPGVARCKPEFKGGLDVMVFSGSLFFLCSGAVVGSRVRTLTLRSSGTAQKRAAP